MVEAALVESLGQAGSGVRFDWGPTAADVLVHGVGALAVVDVLSFTTAVSVAAGRGMAIAPYPLDADGAGQLAARLDAKLAVRRRELSADEPWSLSPHSLRVAPYTPRLVLPSPNGSAIAAAFGNRQAGTAGDTSDDVTVIVAACLRNAAATARWLLTHGYGTEERPVWVIGAGERWPDRSLRPALEDELGAGALAHRLQEAGSRLSPEAMAAASTYASTADVKAAIVACASGRELATMGFPEELAIAGALDADDHASVMKDGMFVRV